MAKHTLNILRCERFLKYVWPFYNIMNERVKADGTVLYSKCDCPSDMSQQLDLPSELECESLKDTVDWIVKWLVNFHAGKN